MATPAPPPPAAQPSPTDTPAADSDKDVNKQLAYSYTKARKEFGRQERFLQDHFRIHANVKPLPRYRKLVMKKTLVDKETQAIPSTNFSEMNTIRTEYADFSVMHEEGGWPKDININDPEQVQRHRKKLEKDDAFIAAVPIMADEMEELIKHNNTIDFYKTSYKCQSFMAGTPGGERELKPSATVVSVYKNPAPQPRRVNRITFAPESVGRMAVAQCPYEFDPYLRDHDGAAYFWDIENPMRPEGTIRAGSAITDVRYHPKDSHNIMGALFTGQVATWDIRVGQFPQSISAYEVSHKDMCTTSLWINSKSGCEFFSSGMDGQVIWWDDRNLSQILDNVYCDPEKGQCRPEFAQGATVLEYEHSLPTKFLAGTDRGSVMVFMKKGKSPNERMIHLYKAHRGPIRACHRNPMFIKNFLTVGDYHLRIFAEDCKESSIIWTVNSESRYCDANWVTSRPSSFVACRNDGALEWWDLLTIGAKSILHLQVCDEPLTALCSSDSGKHVAVGTLSGDVKYVKMSDFMGEFDKAEKPMLAAMFDRESRREKYLETRNREIRLKKRDQEKQEAFTKKVEEEEAEDRKKFGLPETLDGLDATQIKSLKIRHEVVRNPVIQAERDFFTSIENEIKTHGINAFPDKKVVKRSKGDDDDGRDLEVQSSIHITAADLAAFDDFDDHDMLGGDEEEGEASAAPSSVALAAPPPAPEAAPSATPSAAPSARPSAAPSGAPSTAPSVVALEPPPTSSEYEGDTSEAPADQEEADEGGDDEGGEDDDEGGDETDE